MEKVRWGILSVSGHYALRIHDPLSTLPQASIEAIASRDQAKARAAARQFGIPKSYGSYEELIADPAIDAVYIPLPNHVHAQWAIKALKAGKHVLCEKPLAMDRAEAETIAEAARASGKVAMEAFMYRFHPQWAAAARLLKTGELGRPLSIQSCFAYDNRDPANIRNIRETGGGALYDIGCYTVSSARFIAAACPGSLPEPTRALYLAELDPDFQTDIRGTGVLEFGEGGLKASFHLATKGFPAQRVEVLAEKGRLAMELPFNAYADTPMTIEVQTGLGSRSIQCPPADQYEIMLAAFCRSVIEGLPAPTPLSDAIANMAVIDALFRSAKSSSWEGV